MMIDDSAPTQNKTKLLKPTKNVLPQIRTMAAETCGWRDLHTKYDRRDRVEKCLTLSLPIPFVSIVASEPAFFGIFFKNHKNVV